jgi:hypothetical protein
MSTLEKSTTVAVVNNQKIIIIENGEKRVAVRPICDALGIAFEPQFKKLKSDPILSSVVTLGVMTGADGKQYEMVTIPFKYVFGWLFRIDSRNVKPEAQESVLKYQLECYDVLYNHFTIHAEFAEWRQRQLKIKSDELKEVRANFNQAKEKVKETENAIDDIFKLSLEDYKTIKAQMVLEFPEEGGAE